MLTIHGIADFKAREGQELGVSEWVEVTQDLVNRFADVTRDDQWIHVDEERARRGPFGGTIAHGLLTLGLGPSFTFALYSIEGVAMTVNYGYDKVRYPAPLPTGAKVRMRATVTSVDELDGGAQVRVTQVFESDQATKPVCVAEQVFRLYTE